MPICPKCDVAYLQGEHHICERRKMRVGKLIGALFLVAGLALVSVGGAVYFRDQAGEAWFSLGVFIVPAGVVLSFVGAVLMAFSRK